MGRDVIAFEDPSTFGSHLFWTWRKKKGSVAVNRNVARTPDPRVSQSSALNMSPICPIPGSPGSPPPAALTSVICNSFLPCQFSSFSVHHLSSFLSPLSSVIFFRISRDLFPLCPFAGSPDFPTSSSPGNRGRGSRRARWSENTPEVPGKESPEQRRLLGNLR